LEERKCIQSPKNLLQLSPKALFLDPNPTLRNFGKEGWLMVNSKLKVLVVVIVAADC